MRRVEKEILLIKFFFLSSQFVSATVGAEKCEKMRMLHSPKDKVLVIKKYTE